MAKADERGLTDYEMAVAKMADKICEEIDNDLLKVAEAEIAAAQKQHPYPHAVWNEKTNSYTLTVPTECMDAGSLSWTGFTVGVIPGDTVTATAGQSCFIYEIKTVLRDDGWATTATLAPTPSVAATNWIVEKRYDGLTATQCFEIYERSMRGEGENDEKLTELQLQVAKGEWSYRLKVKVAESQKVAQSNNVLLDLDDD